MRLRFARGALAWALWTGLMAPAACDPGEVVVVDVPGVVPPPGDTVHVQVLRPDATAAAGALVRHLRIDVTDFTWPQDLRTDVSGRVDLVRLAGGSLHWVGAEQDDARLGVFGGGEKVYGPTAGSVDLTLPLSAPRSGTVVISEVYMQTPEAWETGGRYYQHGKYVELANNSDTTIYLDGFIVGVAYFAWNDSGRFGHHRCADTEPMRHDSAGVWSHLMWRIPGAGADHPLPPGDAAVLARSAADHTGIHPSMLDLSDAAFEFGVEGAADNPAAANLEWLGPNAINTVTNDFSVTSAFWFVAAPGEVGAFPKAIDPGSADRKTEYWRVPRELIQDVAFIWWDRTGGFFPLGPPVPCRDPVHPDFDRLPGGFLKDSDLYLSAQRRRVVVDGRATLLDTQTSWVDFIKAARTPGQLLP